MAVIDITSFRLADGMDEQAFLDADERVRTGMLYQQSGLVRATTTRGNDGGWAIIVQWASEDDAHDPLATELADLVDPSTIERRRYRTLD